MVDYFHKGFTAFGLNHVLSVVISIGIFVVLTVAVSWLANYFAKHYLVKLVHRITVQYPSKWLDAFRKAKVFLRLSHIVPALIIYYAAPLIILPKIPITASISDFITRIALIYMVLVVMIVGSALLNMVEQICSQSEAIKKLPFKSYIQIVRICFGIIAAIIAIAILVDKSPVVLFTGLGALTAIIILVFKDSILGFVASVQISAYDMVRVGDWIEMPNYGANGDVVDMSLTTIKIQNFDKTIVTVPAYAILSSGVKNWRGMTESGGRRIKRSINIDIDSIKFCSGEMLQRFRNIHYISEYLQNQIAEIQKHNVNAKIDTSTLVNGRHLTNVGVFRAYVEAYLKNHPQIHHKLTFLVRQLQPTAKGLPIELYIFTNDTDWNHYEGIQADIFDHILAVIPEFDLRVFQNISNQSIVVQLPQQEAGVKTVASDRVRFLPEEKSLV